MATKSLSFKPLLVIGGYLAVVFIYPRILIGALGEGNPWTSYLYMYGFGALFFGSGILLILKTGACVPGRGHDGTWLKYLLIGFVYFAGLHGFWIYKALTVPYLGE